MNVILINFQQIASSDIIHTYRLVYMDIISNWNWYWLLRYTVVNIFGCFTEHILLLMISYSVSKDTYGCTECVILLFMKFPWYYPKNIFISLCHDFLPLTFFALFSSQVIWFLSSDLFPWQHNTGGCYYKEGFIYENLWILRNNTS